jgi:hypothetical protein
VAKKELTKKDDPREVSYTKDWNEIEKALKALTVGPFAVAVCVVRNQGEANLAGQIVGKIAALRNRWKNEWAQDIRNARSVWESLRNRWIAGDAKLETWERALKGASQKWIDEETAKRLAKAAAINAEVRKVDEDYVYTPPPVEIQGMGTQERTSAEVWYCDGEDCKCKNNPPAHHQAIHYELGIKMLCRAIWQGRAPADCLEPVSKFLNAEARRLYDRAEVKDGNRFIYPGVRAVKHEVMRRA